MRKQNIVTELCKWLKKKKMKSAVVSQIHDSIIIDTDKDESQNIVQKMFDLLKERYVHDH